MIFWGILNKNHLYTPPLKKTWVCGFLSKDAQASALNEDKIIARKMYNVIKNVEMFSNDVLDNNTFIDKNIFEIPVFDEILEND